MQTFHQSLRGGRQESRCVTGGGVREGEGGRRVPDMLDRFLLSFMTHVDSESTECSSHFSRRNTTTTATRFSPSLPHKKVSNISKAFSRSPGVLISGFTSPQEVITVRQNTISSQAVVNLAAARRPNGQRPGRRREPTGGARLRCGCQQL